MSHQVRKSIYILCLLVGVAIVAQTVFSHVEAAVPQFVNYQSRLRDSSGTAITASTNIQFSIYNTESTGSPSDSESSSGPLLWTETYDKVSGNCAEITPDTEGYFTTKLGTCNAFPSYLDFDTATLYVGVKIESDSEATPRAQLGTAPYAFNADRLDGIEGASFVRSDAADSINATSTTTLFTIDQEGTGDIFNLLDSGSGVFTVLDGGNVGIGDISPASLLTVGSGDLFQVNSSGAIVAIAGLTGATGTYDFSAASTTLPVISIGVWEATEVGLAFGGTGASTAAGARTNLGLVIGTDVQALLSNEAGLYAALSDVTLFLEGGDSVANLSGTTTDLTGQLIIPGDSIAHFSGTTTDLTGALIVPGDTIANFSGTTTDLTVDLLEQSEFLLSSIGAPSGSSTIEFASTTLTIDSAGASSTFVIDGDAGSVVAGGLTFVGGAITVGTIDVRQITGTSTDLTGSLVTVGDSIKSFTGTSTDLSAILLLASNNLSDLNSTSTAIGNLGLTIGTDVQGLLSNEAGLYAALSDVTLFLEGGDSITNLSGTTTDLTVDLVEQSEFLLSNLGDPSASSTIEFASTTWIIDTAGASSTFVIDGDAGSVVAGGLTFVGGAITAGTIDVRQVSGTTSDLTGTLIVPGDAITNFSGTTTDLTVDLLEQSEFLLSSIGDPSASSTIEFASNTLTIDSAGASSTFVIDGDAGRVTINELILGTALTVAQGGTGVTTLNNLITLGTHTTGNYVATVADAGAGDITVVGSGSENAAVTLDITDDSLDFTEFADSLTLDASTTIAFGANNFIFNLDSTGDFDIQDNGTSAFFVRDDGNVGIGTAAPGEMLTIADDGNILVQGGNLITPYGGFGQYENLLTYSEQFDNAVWTDPLSITTTTANNATAPDNTSTADTVQWSSGTLGLRHSVTLTNSTAYTFSIWARLSNDVSGGAVTIDLGDGSSVGFIATSVWQRFSVTPTSGTSDWVDFNHVGSSGFEFWGAQLELGSAANVYARTEGTAITTTGYGLVAQSDGPHVFLNGDVGIGTATPDTSLEIAQATPILKGTLSLGIFPEFIAFAGHYAYVVDVNTDDLKVIDVTDPTSPATVGTLSIGAFPSGIAVTGNYTYVIDQTANDLKVIDVTDPTSPATVGTLSIGGDPTQLAVAGRYAYVVDASSNDLRIIDISDPTTPSTISTLTIGGSPKSIAVAGRYAYVVDNASDDLKVIDVSDPSSPATVGTLSIGASPTYVAVAGRYAYVVDFTANDLKVIDVSNPVLPATVGTLSSIGADPEFIIVAGRYAYVIDSGSDDLKVVDISDPTAPATLTTLSLGGFPYKMAMAGRYLYVIDQTTGSTAGDLKIIDISGIETPTARIGALEAGILSITQSARIDNSLDVGSALSVGAGGILSQGGLAVNYYSTETTAGSEKGLQFDITDTGIVTTGTDTLTGLDFNITRTGAIGGTITTVGLDLDVTGDTGGTSTLTGLDVTVSGADTNYAALFGGGNVGIGTVSPDADLDIEAAENTEVLRFSDSTNTDSVGFFTGNATPESTVTAQLGSLFLDNSNGALYVKNTGDGTNTGWEQVTGSTSGLWQAGSNGTYEDDAAVIIGTDQAETLSNSGFSLSGNNDLFVGDLLGVEGSIYTDGSFIAGASLTLTDGSITQSTGNALNISLGGAAGDDLIVDTTTLVVESDNNRVGIGTASPNEDLHVASSAAGGVRFVLSDDAGTTAYLRQVAVDGINYIQSGTSSTTGSAADLRFTDINGANTWMTIDSTGNVGIGTTAPSTLLHIIGNSVDTAMRIGTDNADTDAKLELFTGLDSYGKVAIISEGLNSSRRGNLHFIVDTTADANSYTLGTDTKLFISGTTGNVGIGTTSPGGPLHVKFGSTSTPAIFESTAGGGAETVVLDLQGPTVGGTDVSINFGLEAGESLTAPAAGNFRSLAALKAISKF